jgi:hypothetical protein
MMKSKKAQTAAKLNSNHQRNQSFKNLSLFQLSNFQVVHPI